MGAPCRGKVAVHRAWRCRSRHADGLRHRRRSAAAAESRLCGARRFHPWLVRTTHALVRDRAAVGAGCKLQYLPGGAALTTARQILISLQACRDFDGQFGPATEAAFKSVPTPRPRLLPGLSISGETGSVFLEVSHWKCTMSF